MTGAVAWGVEVPNARGEEPAGRRGAASRRRSFGLWLLFAVLGASAGAVLGLLRQPDPQNQLESFAWTTSAAIEAARQARDAAHHAEARARAAEKALADAKERIAALSESG